jgi:hypothetical protein
MEFAINRQGADESTLKYSPPPTFLRSYKPGFTKSRYLQEEEL